MKFRLKKFEAYNKFIKAWISEDNNPPNPWQEDGNYKDRLLKLGQYPWSWFSWYTVQRKRSMKLTIEEAINFQVDGYLFEKLVSFCHSVLYKSKKFNFVHAARQENDIHADYVREPFSYKKNVYLETSAVEIQKHFKTFSRLFEELKFFFFKILR